MAGQSRLCRAHVQGHRKAGRRGPERKGPALPARSQDRIRGPGRHLLALHLRHPSRAAKHAGRSPGGHRRLCGRADLSLLVRSGRPEHRRARAGLSVVDLAGAADSRFVRRHRHRRTGLHGAAVGQIGRTPRRRGAERAGRGIVRPAGGRRSQVPLHPRRQRDHQQSRHAPGLSPAADALARLDAVRPAGGLRGLERRAYRSSW